MGGSRSVWRNVWVPWVVSGLLLGIGFLHPWLWICGIAGAALFLHAAISSERVRDAVWGSAIAGTLKAAGALAWIWSTYPLVWLGLEPGGAQLSLIGVYWIIDAASVGIGMIACGASIYLLVRRNERWIAAFPFLFVVAEVVGSFTQSLYSLGPGSAPNFDFSFGYLGHAVAESAILFPFAAFGGVYALSFVGVACATGVYILFRRPHFAREYKILVPTACLVACTVFAWTTVYGRTAELDTHVIAVETYFDSTLFTVPSGYMLKRIEILEAVEAAMQLRPELIVLPEDSRFTLAYQTPDAALQDVSAAVDDADVILIDSARSTDERGETVLRAYVYDTARATVHLADKQYLVPQGEYVPYLIGALLRAVGAQGLMQRIEKNQSYRPGTHAQPESLPDTIPGILFCFESAVPYGIQRIAPPEGLSLVVHPVSHSWFHEPHILWRQLANMLRAQAAWNNVAIVQAGNMAPSRTYFPDGSVRQGDVVVSDDYWRLVEFK